MDCLEDAINHSGADPIFRERRELELREIAGIFDNARTRPSSAINRLSRYHSI